jgi:predicted GNAT family N-acyltransferase
MSDERAAAGTMAVHAASWQRDREAIERIRRAVFIEEQGIAEADEWDDADPVSRHVLAGATKRDAVGTGRLEPTGKIGRVAVLPQYRGNGVGSRIVGHLVNQATVLGLTQVYLHAQASAVVFYERLGFQVDGPEFDEVGIPHRRMRQGIEQIDGYKAGRNGKSEHSVEPG